MASVQVAVDMGSWFYSWNTNRTDYDGINDELGVRYIDDGLEDDKKPILKGVNNVKPPKVRITYGTKKEGVIQGGETLETKIGVCTRMCDPDLTEAQLKKDLAGKKIKVARRGKAIDDFDILSVTIV